jgi:hypothetical protein
MEVLLSHEFFPWRGIYGGVAGLQYRKKEFPSNKSDWFSLSDRRQTDCIEKIQTTGRLDNGLLRMIKSNKRNPPDARVVEMMFYFIDKI